MCGQRFGLVGEKCQHTYRVAGRLWVSRLCVLECSNEVLLVTIGLTVLTVGIRCSVIIIMCLLMRERKGCRQSPVDRTRVVERRVCGRISKRFNFLVNYQEKY